ncbi:hypothetical protein M378DRAFT_170193 [Amanita muscaria Koide BX008]|uniref:IucC family-domain-containing protein n=1 Tax=Amanita muscaria (strain Koide BX008) TaxID=946122 RepID=A0A0C2S7H9_AMAMK|nr:hypothetical protein M378DRAFT_170193 [Amanita muscaria Koide BX008]
MACIDHTSSQRRAAFAVISRLLSCLVTERILRAFYACLVDTSSATGIVVVLSTHLISEHPTINRPLRACDILAIVPVHHPPVCKDSFGCNYGQPVILLDPLDMLPEVYELAEAGSEEIDKNIRDNIFNTLSPPSWKLDSTSLKSCHDPSRIWSNFIEGVVLPDSLRESIRMELMSSYDWQLTTYESPPQCPTLNSTPIEWEQSLVAGHPTHPMHRARMMPFDLPKYDWYHPRIRFVAISRCLLDIFGPLEDILLPLAERAASRCGRTLPARNRFAVVPVHELQVHNIIAKIPEAEVLHPDISINALAQSSIRTVVIPELPGIALKLAVGVKISSSLRTVSHFTATFGPRFSALLPRLKYERELLSVEREFTSAVYRSANPDVAKHLSVLLREEYQPAPNEKLIVCAALLEMDHLGSPHGVAAIRHVLHLDTPYERVEFLSQYLRVACRALLPPLIYNGVALEAHAQNVLVRLDIRSKSVLGFVYRDLGGLRIYPPLLRQSTGIDFQFLPGHCVQTETLEETFPKFYHTFVHNHVQRLIRVLDLHYNGIGWGLLRKYMREVIPVGHALENAWLDSSSREVPSKCLMRMRMRDSYRDMVYGPYPNMILFNQDSVAQVPA